MPPEQWTRVTRSGAQSSSPLGGGIDATAAARIADAVLATPATAEDDKAWRTRWHQAVGVKPSDVGLPAHMD